jgi:putative ABC transport system permease protein
VIPTSSASRGIRNLFRAKTRTIVVILVVGLALAVFLSASMISSNTSATLNTISADMDSTITVQPAGTGGFGMFGGGSQQILSESILSVIWNQTHVKSVNPVIMKIDMGGSSFDPSSGGRPSFTLIEGLDPSQGVFLTQGGTVTISSGRTLAASDKDQYVAIVGQQYATDKSVGLYDSISLNGTSFQVVGIFTTGTTFGASAVIIPYEIAKVAYGLQGMNTVYVAADTIGNMNTLIDNLKTALGSGYDVQSLSAETSQRANSIQSSIDATISNSQFGAAIALVTAAGVMVFVMILVTRERMKEIGILKALGFNNKRIIAQFLVESVSLGLIGLIVGLGIALVGAQYIVGLFGGSTGGSPGARAGGFGGSVLQFQLTPELVFVGLLITIGVGILGSLYPIIRALKLKPAEALRYD